MSLDFTSIVLLIPFIYGLTFVFLKVKNLGLTYNLFLVLLKQKIKLIKYLFKLLHQMTKRVPNLKKIAWKSYICKLKLYIQKSHFDSSEI